MTKYVGARYVPKFIDDPHDPNLSYEVFSVVDGGSGVSYISGIPVPGNQNIPLTDTTYWHIYGTTNGAIINLQNQIGDLSSLTTPDTTDLVHAIDSVNDRIIGKIVDMTALGLPTDGSSDCSTIFVDIIDDDPTRIFYIPSGHYIFNNVPALGSYGTLVNIIIDKEATTNYSAAVTAPFYANWSFLDSTKVTILYNSLHSITVGATNYIDFENISNGAKAAYSEITSISPIGAIGVLGGSDTKNLAGGNGFPIGVMGMSMADDSSNLTISSVEAFYGETYREASTIGASIGMELDHKIDTPTQNIAPFDLPDASINYAAAIQLSNGMTENTHQDLSCGMYFSNNGGKFKKGILFKDDSITSSVIGREAIVMADEQLIDWYDSAHPTQPCTEVYGDIYNGKGILNIGLYDNGSYVSKSISPDSMLGPIKCKAISVPSATYAAASAFAINVSASLDSGYSLLAPLMLQPETGSPVNGLVINVINSNGVMNGYNFGSAYTGAITLIVLEYKEV